MQDVKTADAENAEKNPPHIFDRVFKRLMASSQPAVVGFINGLFNVDYPPDTPVKQWGNNQCRSAERGKRDHERCGYKNPFFHDE